MDPNTNLVTSAAAQAIPGAEFTASLLGLPDPVLLAGALMVLMEGVKKSPIPNWLIPHISLLLGTVGYCLMGGWSLRSACVGVFIGGGAVGLHQFYRQSVERGN